MSITTEVEQAIAGHASSNWDAPSMYQAEAAAQHLS